VSFGKAVATVGGLTMVSRLGGFVRDIIMAAALGAGPGADAFLVALKLPNFFRRLFAEGAFSVAFVPVFAGELQAGGTPQARRFGGEASALLLAMTVPVTVLAVIFMPWVIAVVAPGFSADPVRFALAVDLGRITFFYLPLISLCALVGGMLNAVGRFAAFAFAPTLFNLCLIGAMLAGPWLAIDTGHALAWGVAISGGVQLAWLGWCAARNGMLPVLAWPRLTPTARRMLKLMGPAAIGGGIVQINALVDIVLASLLPAGAVSFLYYADRLYQLPLAVIGTAIGTALLPLLARQIKADNFAGAREAQNRAMELALLFGLPAAGGLALAAGPITSVLFERGAFTAADVQATATAITAFSAGIPAYLLLKGLQAAFYAREDTWTPVKAGLVGMAVNAGLALLLLYQIGHVGIALATSVAAWVNAALLGWVLHRRGLLNLDQRLKRRALSMLVAAVAMAATLAGVNLVLAPALHAPHVALRVGALMGLIGAGMLVYFGLGFALGFVRRDEIRALLRRRPPARDA
jgi:putative peptidoglycan lipid II flippase